MTTKTPEAPGSTLKAYEDSINAQIQGVKAKLDEFNAKARDKAAQGEAAAVDRLKTAKANIDRKLQDLKTTHASNVARAKADIDADVATFKASVDELAGKLKTQTAKK